jgi:ABC-2 type transporter
VVTHCCACSFFTFWGILVCVQLYSSALYRFIGSTIRAVVFGTSTAVLVMLLTFIGTGFVLRKPDMPPWWGWMFWVSPLQYTLTGLANNEFLGDSYQTTTYEEAAALGGKPLSKAVFERFAIMEGNKWRYTPLLTPPPTPSCLASADDVDKNALKQQAHLE